MNLVVKAQWIAALRSGEYKQGREFLRKGDKFCCLGVLCEIAVAEGVIPSAKIDINTTYAYGADRQLSIVPTEVVEWANIPTRTFGNIEINGRSDNLAIQNDIWRCTFDEIADALEEQA